MADDSDDQLKIARRLTATLAEDLALERQALVCALGREPTRAEITDEARRRFRADPSFRAKVIAAALEAEAEMLQAWRESYER
jgi:hypothetical protein